MYRDGVYRTRVLFDEKEKAVVVRTRYSFGFYVPSIGVNYAFGVPDLSFQTDANQARIRWDCVCFRLYFHRADFFVRFKHYRW